MILSMKFMKWALETLARRLPPPRIISGRGEHDPYLSRWYLIGRQPPSTVGSQEDDSSRLPFGVFLYKFHRSDDAEQLHSHPWSWAVALVLSGGYLEERRSNSTGAVYRRLQLPWSINVIRADDYHRVDLLEDESWSLFIAGPKVASWYFWDRAADAYADWRSFVSGAPDWSRRRPGMVKP